MIFSFERFCIPKDEVAEAPHVLPRGVDLFLVEDDTESAFLSVSLECGGLAPL